MFVLHSNVIFMREDVVMAGTTSTGTAGKRANSLVTFKWLYLTMSTTFCTRSSWQSSALPRCKNLTRFSLFVSFCFAVRYCLKCFCFLCFTSSVSFTGSYTEVNPSFWFLRNFNHFNPLQSLYLFDAFRSGNVLSCTSMSRTSTYFYIAGWPTEFCLLSTQRTFVLQRCKF